LLTHFPFYIKILQFLWVQYQIGENCNFSVIDSRMTHVPNLFFSGGRTNKKAVESVYGLLKSEQTYNIHIKTIEKLNVIYLQSTLNQVWSQQERRKLSLKMPGENDIWPKYRHQNLANAIKD